MSEIDGTYSPFVSYPGYVSMAPCMRRCEQDFAYNGCDQSRCWCTKPNLDLRMQSITRCASSSCTYANMNTQTDVDLISGIQVMWCADKGFSPAGMAMPTPAEVTPTTSGSSPRETGTAGTGTRPRTSSGPANTGTSSSGNTNNNNNSSGGGGGGGGMSSGTKAGIGIGATFCALVAILIIVILFKRRKRTTQVLPPPNGYQNNGIPPPQMAPTPYSGNGPFTPPPLQQPAPIAIPQTAAMKSVGGDVSPIEEKAAPAVTISRKEIGSPIKHDISNPSTPAPAFASIADNGPREVQGSVPPPRHEVGNDGQITNTVSTRGMELDSNNITPAPVNQYPGQQQYQQSGQGQWGYGAPAYEVEGGWNGQQQPPRQELSGRQQHGTYELGSGR